MSEFLAVTRQLLAVCGEKTDDVVHEALAAVASSDHSHSFVERVAVLQSALGRKNLIPEGATDPSAFAELVNRAVFLDLPDDELAAYLQRSNHYFERVDERHGSPVLRKGEVSAADVDSYRAQRRRVFSQMVYVKGLSESGLTAVPWKFTTDLCKMEEMLGACFPADMRLVGLMIGWHPIVLKPLGDPKVYFRALPFHKATIPLTRVEDVVDIDTDMYEVGGFYQLGHSFAGGKLGGWYFVGVNGLCRDTIVQMGTRYDSMTDELVDPETLGTWNCKGPRSHTWSHTFSAFLTHVFTTHFPLCP